MSHSYTRIWIHTILGTKDRQPIISANLEQPLHEHIKGHLEKDFDCPVRVINGTPDHVHVLFLLSPKFAVKDILQNMKGESSHWINQENLGPAKFAWQTGYTAFSVSDSGVVEVERYVRNQKEHHHSKTYAEEYEGLLRAHGLQSALETVETVSPGLGRPETHD